MKPRSQYLSDHPPEIPVAPLVDVLLILLAMALLIAPSWYHELQVSVPQAAAATGATKDVPVFELGPDGVLSYQQRPVTGPLLVAATRGLTKVVLAADGATPHAAVVAAMGELQQAGVREVGFLARSP